MSGKAESLTLYVANDDDEMLHKETVNTALPAELSARALQVMRALVSAYQQKNSHHPLADDADVNAVFVVAPDTAIVDLNNAFADGHRSGVLVEQMTLASMAQTLAANLPNVGRVKFLVDGRERDTLAGHADIRSYYDLSAEPWPVAP
ncbi:MAG: GerMN domain-containing protein [Terriglobales bacterium]